MHNFKTLVAVPEIARFRLNKIVKHLDRIDAIVTDSENTPPGKALTSTTLIRLEVRKLRDELEIAQDGENWTT